jgi:predicted dienelactone hydrolase
VARRPRDEAHLAVLRDRVVRRKLARGEDVARERVARRRPEVVALEVVVDRARDLLERGRIGHVEVAEQDRAVARERVGDEGRVRLAPPRQCGRRPIAARLDDERQRIGVRRQRIGRVRDRQRRWGSHLGSDTKHRSSPGRETPGRTAPQGAGGPNLTLATAACQGAWMRFAAVALMLLIASAAIARSGAPADYTQPGPLPVGITTVQITTTSVTTGAPRVLDTQVWYPAVEGTGTPEGAFLRNAEVAKGRHPLIVFSHGSCGIPNQSPFLMQAFASRGMIVAAPPHPGNTLSPTCSTPTALADAFANRPADVGAVADRFLGFTKDKTSRFHRHVNPKRLGVAGHSFGGQTTLRVAADDARFKAGLALAPAFASGITIRRPLMVMTGELDSLTPFTEDAEPSYALGTGPRWLVKILRTGHCAFIPGCAPSVCGAGCEPGTLTAPEANAIVLRYAVPFMLRYLEGDRKAAKALRPDAAPAEVVVEAATGRKH